MTIKATRRYLVTPDLQIPLHHPAAVKNLIKMSKHEKFDYVLNVGDELDMTSQSRWVKNTKLEFAETLDEERTIAQNILYDLGTTDIIRSNHTDRLFTTLLKGAPSLLGLPELVYEKFMAYSDLGIRFHKRAYEFEKGKEKGKAEEKKTMSKSDLKLKIKDNLIRLKGWKNKNITHV